MSKPKPFLLYTFWTNNGTKISTTSESIDISKNVQKEPWFLKMNPNGQIPVLVDRSRNDHVVSESGAILLYLQQHYDTDNKFGWDAKANPDEYIEVLQWIFFAYWGIGPMQNQLQHFNTVPEKIPYAIDRYLNETKRLYGVLEIRLGSGEGERDWLVGPGPGCIPSLISMSYRGKVYYSAYAGIESLDEWPNLKKWLERACARPSSAAGLHIGLPSLT
ncbi:hypothetical protein BT96DRAFT_914425 [Gymnopus androsaceus JB14]|uniref:Thioredoxin-like protein n=1 Tax=Gymnopus androsaceus JB14 TaxID=1447944 RepID=A0A6A4IGH5_9AGAR|nr:hypothetical protein BT96DRAFT_914425 [Gymnopus androsaceus JB14]